MSAPTAWDRIQHLVPGLGVAAGYDRRWLWPDVRAGVVLTAVLIPVGMGYAQASGLPAHAGLYATIVPLLAYALAGPSRIMVLGPDSALAPILLATIVPLSGGDEQRALALAGLMAIMVGAFLLAGGLLRLGFVTDLLSLPIRIGFLNALALIVLASQLPALLGIDIDASGPVAEVAATTTAVAAGEAVPAAVALGVGALAVMAVFRFLPVHRVTGMIVAVVAAVVVTVVGGLYDDVPVVGAMPRGLPEPALGGLQWGDVAALAGPALAVALISFADTASISRALSARRGEAVDGNREMSGLGFANLAGGLGGGFPIAASSSRTPVAEQAGSKTQLTGVVGALLIAAFMLAAPGATAFLPEAVLAAVVIVAALGFLEVRGYVRLWRLDWPDALLSTAAFLGVFLVGVLEGLAVAIGLAFVAFVLRAWRPYRTELGLMQGRRGYHDRRRHPEAERVPGLLILRFDAPLFFVNGGVFNQWIRREVHRVERELRAAGAPGLERVILAAEPITDLDTTAAGELEAVDDWLASHGITLVLAEMKGPVKDILERHGLDERFTADRFAPTVGAAVDAATGSLRDDIGESPDERRDIEGHSA